MDNCWLFQYLGSLFTPDGSQEEDVRSRIAQAKARAGKMRNVWKEEISMQLKLRLYKSAVCSILVYGAEAWQLDEHTIRMLNGANAAMITHITGKTRHAEATPDTKTFDIVSWIRSRRLRWLGHILRLPEHDTSLLKEAVKHIYEHAQEGDLCMDAPITNDWEQLKKLAGDRDSWRRRVKKLKEMKTMPRKPHRKPSTRLQRQRPLSAKKKAQLRRQHFESVRKTLRNNLQQTDIRAYFKPKGRKIDDDDNSGGGAATAVTAFATAARQNKNANIKYTFVPKEKKQKKALDRNNNKKKRKTKKTTNAEARKAYYRKLNGVKTFLGCKCPAERAPAPTPTYTRTYLHDNTTQNLNEPAHQTPSKSPAPSVWCVTAQLNDSELSQLSPHTPTIHGHTNNNNIRSHAEFTPTTILNSPNTPELNNNNNNNNISNFLTPELSDNSND